MVQVPPYKALFCGTWLLDTHAEAATSSPSLTPSLPHKPQELHHCLSMVSTVGVGGTLTGEDIRLQHTDSDFLHFV